MNKFLYENLKINSMEFKQVILVRNDLKLPKGKLAAQVAHASVEAVLQSDKKIVKKWRAEGMKKVVLKVVGEEELRDFQRKAKELSIVAPVITDAGKTVVAPGTVTCLGMGPDEEEKIDSICAGLKII